MVPSKIIVLIILLLPYIDSLMSDFDVKTCTSSILISFNIKESKFRGDERRKTIPRNSFLDYVENDIPLQDGKAYFRHIYSVIIHKDGTLIREDYCGSVTDGLESVQGKICIKQLQSMFIESKEPTDIIKDAFKYFKRSDFNSLGSGDYRFKYFSYLSGMYTFPKTLGIDDLALDKKAPMTPLEFCKMKEFHPYIISVLEGRVIDKRLQASSSLPSSSSPNDSTHQVEEPSVNVHNIII